MANRSTLFTAAVALTLLAAIPKAQCQIQSSGGTGAVDSATGIRTDRLTPKQLRIWGKIENVIQVADKRGRLAHPKLHSLWQRVQESGPQLFDDPVMRDGLADHGASLHWQHANCNLKHLKLWRL